MLYEHKNQSYEKWSSCKNNITIVEIIKNTVKQRNVNYLIVYTLPQNKK